MTDGNIAIPTTAAGPQGPTGQAFNSGTDFVLANAQPARFIFANLNGTTPPGMAASKPVSK